MQNSVLNEVFITFRLPAADLTCGVMYWILGTGDVYVYFGDTNPVISYCCFNDSFAIKLPVLLSIGLALIRAYKPNQYNSAVKSQMQIYVQYIFLTRGVIGTKWRQTNPLTTKVDNKKI